MRFVVTDNKRAGDWGAVYIAKKIKEFNPSPEKSLYQVCQQVVHHFKCIKD